MASSAPLSVGHEHKGVMRVTVKDRYRRHLQDINLNAELTEEKVKLVHEHWNFIANEVRTLSRELLHEDQHDVGELSRLPSP